MPINGPALGALGIGSLFLYSAIKGKSILASAQAIITGQSPQTVKQTNPIAQNTPTAPVSVNNPIGTGPGQTNSGIANAALKYNGHAYLFGGAPGPNGQNPWDCSSDVNWVVGHDLKQSIPGFPNGSYNGSVHGPATLSWISWGAFVSHNAKDAEAGNICVWETHMGIAIGGGKMISALNPQLGTMVTTIDGGAPPGELLWVRRI
jgi:cell wall-associated NlpC family hydrolase